MLKLIKLHSTKLKRIFFSTFLITSFLISGNICQTYPIIRSSLNSPTRSRWRKKFLGETKGCSQALANYTLILIEIKFDGKKNEKQVYKKTREREREELNNRRSLLTFLQNFPVSCPYWFETSSTGFTFILKVPIIGEPHSQTKPRNFEGTQIHFRYRHTNPFDRIYIVTVSMFIPCEQPNAG